MKTHKYGDKELSFSFQLDHQFQGIPLIYEVGCWLVYPLMGFPLTTLLYYRSLEDGLS